MRVRGYTPQMRLYLNGAVFNELSPELTLFENFIGTLDGRGAAVVASHLSELRRSAFDRNVVLFQLLILPVYSFSSIPWVVHAKPSRTARCRTEWYVVGSPRCSTIPTEWPPCILISAACW